MTFEEVSREMLVLMFQHVSSRVAGFCGVVAVSMGKLQNPSLLNVSEEAVMSVCVAGVSLWWHSNMLQDASKVVVCGRRNTCATCSEGALHFSWQAQHFGHL